MTQPIVPPFPAAPPPPAHAPPPPPSAPPEPPPPPPVDLRTITAAQLADRIREEAGLSVEEMEQLRRTGRMPGWDVEGACPSFPQTHTIYAMFYGSDGDRTDDHLPGDVRVYARPRVFVAPDGEFAPFFRIVLNRAANSAARTDAMPFKAWFDDVAFEYRSSVVEDDDEEEEEEDEEEDEEEYKCKATVPTSTPGVRVACDTDLLAEAKFCHACGSPVRKCGNCSHYAQTLDKFCAGCGLPLL